VVSAKTSSEHRHGGDRSGSCELRDRRYFSFEFLVGDAPLDSDQQFFLEHGEDALEDRDGWDVVAGFEL
jgi:hypothetical protein